jgi:hypothetical protein
MHVRLPGRQGAKGNYCASHCGKEGRASFRAVLCPFFIGQVKHVASLKILTCIQVIYMTKIRGWFKSFFKIYDYKEVG